MRTFLIITLFLLVNSSDGQHIYPSSISSEAEKALSYYPELKETPITFAFKADIKKSTMQAQPVFKSLLLPAIKRSYVIYIAEYAKIDGKKIKVLDMPKDVLIGWLGHELGHIMDYKNRSSFNLVIFGIRYLFIDNHIKSAERAADTFAVESGMYHYILKTKNYILTTAGISQKYIDRIKKYYLSPEEIMEIVNASNPTEELIDGL